MGYHEETTKVRHDAATIYGVPALRYVEASRNSPGPGEADKMIQPLLDALTRPLTKQEQARGRWAPVAPRILFEGTLEDAEVFYNQTEPVPGMNNTPFAMYTDGLPVILPTEEKVAAMLKGTSHKPDEVITLQRDVEEAGGGGQRAKRKKGDVVKYMPLMRTATVEQVAVNAVMAGCKPEYFPVVLAMAESGGGCADGRGLGGAYIMSGPIYKEIGMNVSYSRFGPGCPVNKSLGRVGALMYRNLGGFKDTETAISVTTYYGNAVMNGGLIFAEYAEGLPQGWKGLNEEMGFQKNDSVLMTFRPSAWNIGQEHMPGVYRSLQRTGHGAVARYLDVKGIPGPHNYMEFLTKDIWACREGAFTIVLVPQMAQDLANWGFKTKEQIYEWMWKRSFEPLGKYRMRGRPDEHTNGWMAIEKTSGKRWRELPDDYMVPAGGNDFKDYLIIVADGEETCCDRFGGGRGAGYSIDNWR